MFSKPLRTAMIAAMALSTATAPAFADNNLGAAIVGGIIGGALINEANKKKKTTTTTYSNTAQRQENREIQTSLNYFGFPAGVADGVLGAKSRSAISQYQVYMGFPATGQLTPYERDFLISSYNRAQIGGPQVIKAMQSAQGVRSLLTVWRDEAMGTQQAGGYGGGYGGLPIEVSRAIDEIASSSEPSAEQLMQRSGFMQLADLNRDGRNDYILDTSVSGSSFWCGASHCTVMVFASTPEGYRRTDFQARGVTPASFECHQGSCRLVEPGAAPTPQPSLPQAVTATAPAPLGGIQPFSMVGSSAPAASLASHCSKISLLTNSNGGFVTVATLRDPDLALSEQFCLARTYAIGAGEDMVAKVQGLTPAQVDAQCDAFGPALAPYVAKLGSASASVLTGEVQQFVLQSNMSLDQLANTGRICLFSGYRRDKMEVALGSALLMVGIGQIPYAELVGHHLSQGFGVAKSAAQAQGWYTMAVTALESGATPVFAPGQPERVTLIKAAASGLGGGAMTVPARGGATSGLPSFSLE